MATTITGAGTSPQPTRTALAAAVTGALAEAGVSRLEASERTGIPRSTLYRKCDGIGKAFDADELARLAALLGVTVSALVARAEEMAA